jgi:hypothetical protein
VADEDEVGEKAAEEYPPEEWECSSAMGGDGLCKMELKNG